MSITLDEASRLIFQANELINQIENSVLINVTTRKLGDEKLIVIHLAPSTDQEQSIGQLRKMVEIG